MPSARRSSSECSHSSPSPGNGRPPRRLWDDGIVRWYCCRRIAKLRTTSSARRSTNAASNEAAADPRTTSARVGSGAGGAIVFATLATTVAAAERASPIPLAEYGRASSAATALRGPDGDELSQKAAVRRMVRRGSKTVRLQSRENFNPRTCTGRSPDSILCRSKDRVGASRLSEGRPWDSHSWLGGRSRHRDSVLQAKLCALHLASEAPVVLRRVDARATAPKPYARRESMLAAESGGSSSSARDG